MNKGYWIIRVDVSDADKFAEYAKHTPAALDKYGGRFLVRGGEFECVEGAARSRSTIVEFPSYQSAMDCWNSPEYKAAKEFRDNAAVMDIVIIEGCV